MNINNFTGHSPILNSHQIRLHKTVPLCHPSQYSHARLVHIIGYCPLLRRNLTGCRTIRRRHIQCRILEEEIPWSQQQRHRLRRHNRIVFRGREMRDAKGVPEHDIGVVDAFIAMRRHPRRESLRRLARRLGHMPTSGVDLVVLVWGHA